MDEEKKACPGCGDKEFDGEFCSKCNRFYCEDCGKLLQGLEGEQGQKDEPRLCQCPPPICGARGMY